MTIIETTDSRPAARKPGEGITLVGLDYRGKMNGTCFARMTLKVWGSDGENQATSEKGSVDAIFKAIKGIVPHTAKLHFYDVQALTEGPESSAEVTVVLRDSRGEYKGVGTHTDTLIASALAYIEALNQYKAR